MPDALAGRRDWRSLSLYREITKPTPACCHWPVIRHNNRPSQSVNYLWWAILKTFYPWGRKECPFSPYFAWGEGIFANMYPVQCWITSTYNWIIHIRITPLDKKMDDLSYEVIFSIIALSDNDLQCGEVGQKSPKSSAVARNWRKMCWHSMC